MYEIKCPNCHTVFKVDENSYNEIVAQIRNEEFKRELDDRFKTMKIQKELEINDLKRQSELTLKDQLTKKEIEITKLQTELTTLSNQQSLAISNALNEKEKELLNVKNEIDLLKEKHLRELNDLKLNNDQKASEAKEERIRLENKLNALNNEKIISEKNIKERYEDQLKLKDEQIAYYKDYKLKLSTKMVGESLERYCENEFNKLRATGFQNSYFEKDNDSKNGSKGDYIYREIVDGQEVVSIMFEMKNEQDQTASKHKNEDFFKELDKDRREKKCEYAVLVSLLEADSDLYNNGIVDVSYRYEKMYVIRPQFFISLITILRNAALKSLDYRKELAIIKEQNLDITRFEENMNNFKEAFGRNYSLAAKRFNEAIEEIDISILHLEKIKPALLSSEINLRLANNKVEDLTIKKLTYRNPTMKEMFDNLKK